METYCPMRTCIARVGTRLVDCQRPLFVGYVFVYIPGLIGMHAVRWSEGVSAIVGGTHSPSIVPDRIVDELRAAETLGQFDERPKPKVSFKPGEPVRILAGPMQGFVATVLKHKPGERVHVLLAMLGSERTVRISSDGVERIGT